jgi:hypothetical protein
LSNRRIGKINTLVAANAEQRGEEEQNTDDWKINFIIYC